MIDYDEAIKRLKEVPDGTMGVYRAANALMGGEPWGPDDFRDTLVEVLESARDSIPLPKDTNGEVIRLGDKLQYNLTKGKSFEVKGMAIDAELNGWEVYNVNGCAYSPDTCRHRHKPTIEDVLHEFMNDAYDAMRTGHREVLDETYSEYAEKLREVMGE